MSAASRARAKQYVLDVNLSTPEWARQQMIQQERDKLAEIQAEEEARQKKTEEAEKLKLVEDKKVVTLP